MIDDEVGVEEPETTYKEFYPVNPPFGFVGIQVDSDGKKTYNVIEPTITEEESRDPESRLKEPS